MNLMKTSVITFLLLIASTVQVLSQNFSVQGKVVDKEKGASLRSANVALIHLPDSVTKGAITGSDGSFEIDNLSKGKYLLKITYLGFATHTANIEITNKPLRLATIALQEEAIRLGTVEVEGKAPPVVMKNDTAEFSARAFKTNPDATAEDLVTKVPGVTVQQGKVQAQGEDVKQVLVDGKPFFGQDPTAALRNLPAELIDRIQVFDQQSERSQFTGFDDGNTSKTLNLITRTNMRNGQFGKAFGGYGADNEYKAGGNLNIFNGDQKLTILAQSNNVNEQNFAIEDILGATGAAGRLGGAGMRIVSGVFGSAGASGFGGRIGTGGGDFGNFLVTPRGGISTTHSIGLNYTDKWSRTIDVTGSYFFNVSDNDAVTSLYRQFVLAQNASQVYNEDENASNKTNNHRVNFRFDWQIDSTNSLFIRPRFTLQQNDGNSRLKGETYLAQSLINSNGSTRSTDLLGLSASNEILYRHKFETKGRTFSIGANSGYSHNNGESYLLSDYASYSRLIIGNTLDQFSDLKKNGWSVDGNITYTEPVSNKSMLQFSYAASQSKNESDKKTFRRPNAGSAYDLPDTALTNTYSNTYLTQSAGADYRLQDSVFSATLGAVFQWALLNGNQRFPFTGDVRRSFQDILPNAILRWRFTQQKNLFITYRTRTSPPGIDQLQNVIDNSNPLQLRSGNPDLKQDYQHSLSLRYMSANFMQMSYFFTMISGSYTMNSIGNNTIVSSKDTLLNSSIALLRGAQLIQPVNIDGAFSVRSLVTYGMPVEFVKSNINLSTFVNLSRSPGKINGEVNYSTTPTVGAIFVVSSNISPELDFTVTSFSTKSFVRNSLQKELDADYFTQNSRLRLNWIFWEGIVFTSELGHQYSTGLSQGYNQSIVLWNFGLGKKFLPNNAGELKLTVFDVLNQNKNTQRSSTDAYIEDTRTNTLQRYALLTFTYTLRNFGSQK